MSRARPVPLPAMAPPPADRPAGELFCARVPSLDPHGQLPGQEPGASAFDLGRPPDLRGDRVRLVPVNRPVPVSWESDIGSHAVEPPSKARGHRAHRRHADRWRAFGGQRSGDGLAPVTTPGERARGGHPADRWPAGGEAARRGPGGHRRPHRQRPPGRTAAAPPRHRRVHPRPHRRVHRRVHPRPHRPHRRYPRRAMPEGPHHEPAAASTPSPRPISPPRPMRVGSPRAARRPNGPTSSPRPGCPSVDRAHGSSRGAPDRPYWPRLSPRAQRRDHRGRLASYQQGVRQGRETRLRNVDPADNPSHPPPRTLIRRDSSLTAPQAQPSRFGWLRHQLRGARPRCRARDRGVGRRTAAHRLRPAAP